MLRTIEELKKEAVTLSTQYDINWDKMENPVERDYFVSVCKATIVHLPMMENIHADVEENGVPSMHPLNGMEVPPEEYEEFSNRYIFFLESDLIKSYALKELYERYTLVSSIVGTSSNGE